MNKLCWLLLVVVFSPLAHAEEITPEIVFEYAPRRYVTRLLVGIPFNNTQFEFGTNFLGSEQAMIGRPIILRIKHFSELSARWGLVFGATHSSFAGSGLRGIVYANTTDALPAGYNTSIGRLTCDDNLRCQTEGIQAIRNAEWSLQYIEVGAGLTFSFRGGAYFTCMAIYGSNYSHSLKVDSEPGDEAFGAVKGIGTAYESPYPDRGMGFDGDTIARGESFTGLTFTYTFPLKPGGWEGIY